ncbi:hypothetical protein DF186_14630, partial [Enterococcus hirae]
PGALKKPRKNGVRLALCWREKQATNLQASKATVSIMHTVGYTIVAEYGYHTANNMANGNRGEGQPTDAWERDKQGLPWQSAPGQLAIQRIAVRAAEEAVALGP